jgi:hypothetical protein
MDRPDSAAPMNRAKCVGHKSDGSGEPCANWPMHGQTVCHAHGGKAKQNRKAAAERMADQAVRVLADTYGLPVETTPEQAILDEVQRTAGHVAWLEQQVHALTRGELVWGITKVKTGGDDGGVTEEAVPHALLRLYQEERKHLVTVCAAALRAGIEERRVKLAEQQGALVAQVIRAILGDLDLSLEQQARVPDVVPRHLRLLSA